MKMYLVTHGDRNYGADPEMTEKGQKDVAAIRFPDHMKLSGFVTGTGKRHMQTLTILGDANDIDWFNWHTNTSPFCGSADSLNADKQTVTLANGSVIKLSDYENDFDAWAFISCHKEGTLFSAGGELMKALVGNTGEKGHLYELDVDAKTARKIQ